VRVLTAVSISRATLALNMPLLEDLFSATYTARCEIVFAPV
jgi:hypothetical protein